MVLRKVIFKGRQVTDKLADRYDGPYEVIYQNKNLVTYIVRRCDDQRVHHTQIKKYYVPPSYLSRHPAYRRITQAESGIDGDEGEALTMKENSSGESSWLGDWDSGSLCSDDGAGPYSRTADSDFTSVEEEITVAEGTGCDLVVGSTGSSAGDAGESDSYGEREVPSCKRDRVSSPRSSHGGLQRFTSVVDEELAKRMLRNDLELTWQLKRLVMIEKVIEIDMEIEAQRRKILEYYSRMDLETVNDDSTTVDSWSLVESHPEFWSFCFVDGEEDSSEELARMGLDELDIVSLERLAGLPRRTVSQIRLSNSLGDLRVTEQADQVQRQPVHWLNRDLSALDLIPYKVLPSKDRSLLRRRNRRCIREEHLLSRSGDMQAASDDGATSAPGNSRRTTRSMGPVPVYDNVQPSTLEYKRKHRNV